MITYHKNAKLTPIQVLEIFYSTDKEEYLATVYGVSITTINYIWHKRNWRSLTKTLDRHFPPADLQVLLKEFKT